MIRLHNKLNLAIQNLDKSSNPYFFPTEPAHHIYIQILYISAPLSIYHRESSKFSISFKARELNREITY